MIRNGYKDTRFLALQQKKTEDNGIQMLKSIENHTAMYIFLYICRLKATIRHNYVRIYFQP